jgi:hypothetical protein
MIFLLSKKRVLDIHGVVPEEFEMCGDYNNYKIFNSIEKFAVKKADVIVSVTNKMADHVIKKNGIINKKNIIVLPILPNKGKISNNLNMDNMNSIIYCGGLQKWQQVDKMLEYVNKNKNKNKFTFLVPDPEQLLSLYKDKYEEDFPGTVTSSPSEEVSEWYKKNSLGLVLREDIIVNNMACPTKLIEYFQNDILPIVDSENIGDFKDMGYRYISYKDELPSQNEWKKMILENKSVYVKIYDLFEANSKQLRRLL